MKIGVSNDPTNVARRAGVCLRQLARLHPSGGFVYVNGPPSLIRTTANSITRQLSWVICQPMNLVWVPARTMRASGHASPGAPIHTMAAGCALRSRHGMCLGRAACNPARSRSHEMRGALRFWAQQSFVSSRAPRTRQCLLQKRNQG